MPLAARVKDHLSNPWRDDAHISWQLLLHVKGRLSQDDFWRKEIFIDLPIMFTPCQPHAPLLPP